MLLAKIASLSINSPSCEVAIDELQQYENNFYMDYLAGDMSYKDFSGGNATTIVANSSITIQSDGTNWYRIR